MIVGIGVDIEDISPAARARRMAWLWASHLFALSEQMGSARSLA
jgi:hypothetical protein